MPPISTTNSLGFHHVFQSGGKDSKRCLILLHGTGGDENQLMGFGKALDPEASLLGIRGKSNEEGMNRFFRRYSEGIFDVEDIQMQAEALARFLEIAKSNYHVSVPLVGVGFSNGANMLASMHLLHPESLSASVMLRGMLPLTPSTPPHLHGKKGLMLNGEQDSMIPTDEAAALASLLKSSGMDLTCRTILKTGHGLTAEDAQIATAWIQSL